MGLKFPKDLAAWHEWQQRADIIRLAKTVVLNIPTAFEGLFGFGGLPEEPEIVAGYLHTKSDADVKVLSVLDVVSATSTNSLISPLEDISSSAAVWSAKDISHLLPGNGWNSQLLTEEELYNVIPDVKLIMSWGHYMKFGATAHRLALLAQAEFIVVQHGLLTPFAPPLPANSTLFAFSEEDAHFWISGRTDVDYEVVGSQLFYEAAQKAQNEDFESTGEQPIFLGQMHGAELPRASYAKAGYTFCKENGARYRPHPQEKDKLSVLTHRLWAKMGIEIDSGSEPLNKLTNPVVSVFSTGVLEAAIRGVPAWVYHPNPPQWVEDFWRRYGMNRWGQEPTPAPHIPDHEPAQAIAEYIKERLN